MKKHYKRIFIIATIFVVVFYFYYTFPRRFEGNYNGIEYRLGNDQYQKEIFIEVDGWYTRKIFSSDYFQGSVIIENTSLSKVKIFTQKDREQLLGISEDGSEPISFGDIYIKKRFEEFTICVHENGDKPGVKHWNGGDGLMISAPADNREIALNLSNRLIKSFCGEKIILQ